MTALDLFVAAARYYLWEFDGTHASIAKRGGPKSRFDWDMYDLAMQVVYTRIGVVRCSAHDPVRYESL